MKFIIVKGNFKNCKRYTFKKINSTEARNTLFQIFSKQYILNQYFGDSGIR